jgi:serine/threonine protein kinase
MLFSPRVAAYICREVADGLEHAHKKTGSDGKPLRIVHRDISPPNVLVSTAGEVKITDFGIAKASLRASQTGIGVVKGKYAYMAPEQARAEPIDHRADLFALGCVLYECATGKPVYPDMPLPALLDRVARVVYEPPEKVRPGLPSKLVAVIKKCLAAKAEERFQSARQIADELTDLLFTMPPNPEAELSILVGELSGTPSTPSIPPVPAGHSILDDDFDDSTQIESMSVLRSRMAPQPAQPTAPSTQKPTFRDEATRAFKRVDTGASAAPTVAPIADDLDREDATMAMRGSSAAGQASADVRALPTLAPPPRPLSPGAAKVRSPGAAKAPPRPPPSPSSSAMRTSTGSSTSSNRDAPTVAPPTKVKGPPPPSAQSAPSNPAFIAPVQPIETRPAALVTKASPSAVSPTPDATNVPMFSDPPTVATSNAWLPKLPLAPPAPQFDSPLALPVAAPEHNSASLSRSAPSLGTPAMMASLDAQSSQAPPATMPSAPSVQVDPFAQAPAPLDLSSSSAPPSFGLWIAAAFAVIGVVALVVVFVVTR